MLYKISEDHYINTDQVVSVEIRGDELRFTFLAGYSKSFTDDSKEITEQKLNDYVHFCNG